VITEIYLFGGICKNPHDVPKAEAVAYRGTLILARVLGHISPGESGIAGHVHFGSINERILLVNPS
jgi:hypothetical protein